MNVAVAEIGGNLKAFARMEEAWTASINISQGKAYTAASLGLSTKELSGMVQPLFGIDATNDGRIVTFAGGVPLKRDGKVVGAVDVSGAAAFS